MTPSTSHRLRNHLRAADIRGMARLAAQATAGVTGIVEGVHQSVWGTLGVPGGEARGRTRGLTGLVYRGIHGVTRLVETCLDTVLPWLEPLIETTADASSTTAERETVIAALNGVMGDRLVATHSPFATPMALRHRGETLDARTLAALPEATGKVLLLIHGLCMHDGQWRARHEGEEVDHGEALATAHGYTPVHLRYNSGLHTSHNGRELSARLEWLVTHWPTPIDELAVVAHSMGGLLIRGACRQAKADARKWLGDLKTIVFLGTPHHGAPLERAGNWVDVVLASTPYTAPFATIGQLRSAGITDLRFGHVVDEDWQGHDRFHRSPDPRQIVPLPEGVACYAVAATTAASRSDLTSRLIGDGLVSLRSALGQHDDPKRVLFAESSRRIVYGVRHVKLLSSPEVTKQLVRWMTPAKG